jgi:hypothetical protein
MACVRFCPGRMLKNWINCEIWKRDEAGTAWISKWAIEDFWLLPFSIRQIPHGCRLAVAWDMLTISVRFPRMETWVGVGYHYVWLVMLGVKAKPIRPSAIMTTSQTILPMALALDIKDHAVVRRLHCIPQQPWETSQSPCSIPSKITCLVRRSASAQEPLPWIAQHSSLP